MYRLLSFLRDVMYRLLSFLRTVNASQEGQLTLPDLSGVLGGLFGGGAKAPERVGFRTYLHIADGDLAYDTEAKVVALIVAGQFVKIWQKTIPAQQMIHWGFGSPTLPHNQGYLWLAILDAAAGMSEGMLRLVQANARETRRIVVAEFDTRNLHLPYDATWAKAEEAALSNINTMMALPEKVDFPFVGEDSKLILEYNEATTPAASDIAEFSIPITVYQ